MMLRRFVALAFCISTVACLKWGDDGDGSGAGGVGGGGAGTGGGSAGNGGGGAGGADAPAEQRCVPMWSCKWSDCTCEKMRTRTCTDMAACGTDDGNPGTAKEPCTLCGNGKCDTSCGESSANCSGDCGCTPMCSGKVCGPSGCGSGVCGSCTYASWCMKGKCAGVTLCVDNGYYEPLYWRICATDGSGCVPSTGYTTTDPYTKECYPIKCDSADQKLVVQYWNGVDWIVTSKTAACDGGTVTYTR